MENGSRPDNFFTKISRRWNKRTEWIVVVGVFAVSIPLFYLFATEKAERHNSGTSFHESRQGTFDSIVFDYDQHPYLNGGRQLRESNYEWMMPRHRMPGYSYLLSLLWDPETAYPKTKTDPRAVSDGYFERGKRFNILLSIGVLIALFAFLRLWLPAIEALIATWAFGWFLAIFKAPYVQPENLFYLTLTIAYCLMWSQLRRPTWIKGGCAGLALAATYILKSAVIPLIALFVACFALKVLAALLAEWREVRAGDRDAINWKVFGWYIAKGTFVPVTFLAVLSPYFLQTWRVYGSPFWDVHSKYYMWMEDREEKYKWRDMGIAGAEFQPPEGEELPSFGKYMREHSVKDIFTRFQKGIYGFRGRIRADYRSAYYLAKNICLVSIIVVAILGWRRFLHSVGDRWPEALFVVGFFTGYGLLYGWYENIGVGPRLILGLFLPFLVTTFLITSRFGDRTVDFPKMNLRFNPRVVINAIIIGFLLVNTGLVFGKYLWLVEGGQ